MYCSFIKSALRGHRLSSQLRPSFRKPQIQNTRLKITLEPQIINQRVFLNLALIVCLILRTQLIKIILDPWTKAENVALKDKADKFQPKLTAQMAVEAHSQEHAVSKMSIKHKRQLLLLQRRPDPATKETARVARAKILAQYLLENGRRIRNAKLLQFCQRMRKVDVV